MHEVEKEAAEVTRRIGRVGKTAKVIEHKMMSASNTLSGQRAVDRAVEVLRRVKRELEQVNSDSLIGDSLLRVRCAGALPGGKRSASD